MYRYTTPYPVEAKPSLPDKCRPIIRYHEESFGYLVAFPSGKVGMYKHSVLPLLVKGATIEECRPHLLSQLSVPTEFHFSTPLMAWLEITRKCNLQCPHCFVEGGQKRSSELSTGRILQLLEEWAEMGVFSVVITGGEPTIHPDFITIVRHAYELGFAVSIATNGMALRPKLLDQIPQDDVIISMSIDEAHGQGAARGVSDFEYVTQRLLQVRDYGFNTSIMTTTTHENARGLERIIDWALANDISLRSVPFVPMGRGSLYRMMLNTTADVELAARFWLAEEKWERVRDHKLGLCTGKIFNFLLTMVFASRRCMSGRGLCYVDSSGDVYPCTTCSGARVLCGGNVQYNQFQDIWKNDENWAIRRITWKDFEKTCQDCPINDDKYFCTGRCPGSSSVHNNTLNGCGMTEFLRRSVLRREELFRENVRSEPRVEAVPSFLISSDEEIGGKA
ncbi:MAG: radical SAM protein [Acidobacteriia bacterium]|nr:radical SAM protein [Terriglobia bacterium]